MQGVEYDFGEDLDGDKLMNNLSRLGRGGDIMELACQQEFENDDNNENEEESSYPPPQKKSRKIIGGAMLPAGDNDFLNE